MIKAEVSTNREAAVIRPPTGRGIMDIAGAVVSLPSWCTSSNIAKLTLCAPTVLAQAEACYTQRGRA
jgi:hypothetical protein